MSSILRLAKESFVDESEALWGLMGMRSSLSSKKQDALYNSFIETISVVSDLSSILEAGRRARGGILITLLASCLSSKKE